jgi:2-oxo-3-hexenedioate decarboxylase
MASVNEIATALIGAQRARAPLAEPFTARGELDDTQTAYDVQDAVVADRTARGARVIGAKLGLTSAAKQQQMNVDKPLYGWLTSDMLIPSGEAADLDAFIHPRAEPEIAFLLGEELAGTATIASVLAATELVFSAIEIIDSRYDAFRFGHLDVVADNASAAGVVIGSRPRPPADAGDLRLCGCVLRLNGRVAATAAGAAALGHPAAPVAWLSQELHRRGRTLPAGSLVLSGALTEAVPLVAGTTVTAEFDGLGTASVRA